MNEMEMKLLDNIKKEYGQVWEKKPEELVLLKISQSKVLFDYAVEEFKENQSAKNYNLVVTTMISLQYWNQKRVDSFSISEEF